MRKGTNFGQVMCGVAVLALIGWRVGSSVLEKSGLAKSLIPTGSADLGIQPSALSDASLWNVHRSQPTLAASLSAGNTGFGLGSSALGRSSLGLSGLSLRNELGLPAGGSLAALVAGTNPQEPRNPLAIGAAAPASAPAPAKAGLDEAMLGKWLEECSYTVTSFEGTHGRKVYEFKNPRGRWSFTVRSSLSEDRSYVWINVMLADEATVDRAPAHALKNLLVRNNEIGPMHFAFMPNSKLLVLSQGLPAAGLTKEAFRDAILNLTQTAADEEAAWNPESWKASAPPAAN